MANWKKVFKGQKLNIGLTAFSIGSDIVEGKGIAKSIGAGALDFAKWEIISGLVGGPAMLAYTAYQIGGAAIDIALETGKEKTAKITRGVSGTGTIGRGFYDNDYTATMRQRSLEAIGGHQGIVNNALGSEARRRASNIRY